MTDTEQPDRPGGAADAELADAMDSIQSTGEDWRSSERGTDHAQNDTAANGTAANDTAANGAASPETASNETDEEIDNG